MSRFWMVVRPVRLLCVLAAALAVGACDGSAADACDQLVDAYARSWQRCMRSTYDMAKANFSAAFQCSSAKDYDGDKVNQCVSALNSLDCNAVKNGVSPGACDTGALTR
jgi:hypothetical protein